MKSLFRSAWGVLRVALYAWLPALVGLVRRFCTWLRRRLREKRDPDRGHRAATTQCVPIQDPAYVRPDPLIYSQGHLAAQGLNYTWDNPDIRLFLNGVAVDSHDLAPATTYDIIIRVWNGSVDGPVVAMPVHLSFLSFGVGTVAHPVATRHVDVGVKGAATNPAFVTVPWRTPDAPGHYCLQALLDPVDDLDYTNNLGQHNTDVTAAQSPASFSFELRNDTELERAYRFAVDTYELGRPRPCPERPEARPRDRTARHRGDHPLPAGWDVDIVPETPTLAPGAAIPVLVTVTPPPEFSDGSQVINVHAYYHEFHADRLAGGVTVTVTAGV